ncbi:MAG TPA: hypothetical protein VFD69_00430 [Vicinamibacterales bacterium]|nr:hypothetical protein [Vicinamibacterales bacterium]
MQGALEATPSRIPVILGGCGTGRTSMLQRLRDRMGRAAVQYLDVERCASTPERFLTAVVGSSPFASHDHRTPSSARDAFDMTMAFISTATAPGGAPATFLLDEVLELRTFESFPGLRHVLRDLFDALATSNNRFVLTSRYVARAHKLLRDATARFEVMHVLPLTSGEITDLLAPAFNGYDQVAPPERDDLSRTIEALSNGRACYAASLGEATARMAGTGDAVGALAALLSPAGELDRACRFSYELRLHRARGYGALKAILDILAAEEPLTLTEISLRLRRTPGSTKDYLSWLEDVDLVASSHKKYSFTDPLLRLWVRLHCRPVPPPPEDVAREVQAYALARLQTVAPPAKPAAPERAEAATAPAAAPAASPELAYAGVEASSGDDRKGWGIIEID